MTTVGVLAIQGDFEEHRKVLERLGVCVREIRLPDQLDEVDGLIIPGGESTTIVQLIDIYEMRNKLRERILADRIPTWGTCAGMIVMAGHLTDHRPEPLGLMDTNVSRNAFGRQIDSFEVDLEIDGVEGPPVSGSLHTRPRLQQRRRQRPRPREVGRWQARRRASGPHARDRLPPRAY